MSIKLSAVIITFNEAEHLDKCLSSLESVADEILVVDSFSTDRTKEICEKHDVRFIKQKFLGYKEQKNFAMSKARFNYILSVDGDEALSEQLKNIMTPLFNKHMNDILDGTFSTGINIVNLHNIIFASPSKSQIRVLQSIGRGLRKSTLDTTVYDIADDLHWKSNKNYTLNHSGERVKIYSKEKFKFKIHEVKLL